MTSQSCVATWPLFYVQFTCSIYIYSCDFRVGVLSGFGFSDGGLPKHHQGNFRDAGETPTNPILTPEMVIVDCFFWMFLLQDRKNISCVFIDFIGGTWFCGFSKSSGAWCLLSPVAMKVYYGIFRRCIILPILPLMGDYHQIIFPYISCKRVGFPCFPFRLPEIWNLNLPVSTWNSNRFASDPRLYHSLWVWPTPSNSGK